MGGRKAEGAVEGGQIAGDGRAAVRVDYHHGLSGARQLAVYGPGNLIRSVEYCRRLTSSPT